MQQQLITNKKIEMLLEELKEVKVRLDKFLVYVPPKGVQNHKSVDDFEGDYLAIKPSVRRRLDRLSKELDEGRGRKFKSAKEFSTYLDNL